MSLLDSLQKDMVAAMKAKDKGRLATVRMLKAAVTNEQINVGHDLTPDEEVSVLSRELKHSKLLGVMKLSKNSKKRSKLLKVTCQNNSVQMK